MVVSLAYSGCTPLPLRKTHFGYTRQIVNLDSAKTRRPEIMPPKPTVSLDIISLAASSCGYYRSQIEQRAAHECAVHLATQNRARTTSTTPSSAVCSARCARAGASLQTATADSEGCTDQAPSRDQGHPGGAHGRSNDSIASPCHGMRCPPVSPLFASWAWLLHTRCSLEAIDITVYERNP